MFPTATQSNTNSTKTGSGPATAEPGYSHPLGAASVQTHTSFAAAPTSNGTELSLIIPICNEVDTIDSLHEQLTAALAAIGRPYEIIYIDDGSNDGSYEKLERIWQKDHTVRVIKFARNFGKTAAMSAALDSARGEIMIPMDADLQNDPKDIVRLLDKLEEGYDVVSGWRKKRYDELFLRLIPSWIANRLISTMTGVHLRDYGCCLKAYRRAVIQDVKLYGEMHRFVPIYASWHGARVTEIPVIHHPRRFGKSKYGISRTTKVLLDLITVTFMSNYLTKPIYVFGTAGLGSLGLSFASFVWMIFIRYAYNTHFTDTPMPVLTAMFFMIGIQFILMGLLAELLMRTYHESQGKRTYVINRMLENESGAAESAQINFTP